MGEQSNKKKNLLPKGQKKQNYQLWIILVLVAIVFGIYFNSNTTAKTISQKKFEDMLLSNDIQKITLVQNQDVVEITLKESALQNSKYKADIENNNSFGMTTGGPHYKFEVASADSFHKDFKELEAKLPADQRNGYSVEKRSDMDAILMQWGILFLILFGFWFLMRRMTGNAGPGGQIFNIGKSPCCAI